MKQTLRDKIVTEIEAMGMRLNQLDKHIKEYTKAENFADALKSKVKYDTINMFKDRLQKALS